MDQEHYEDADYEGQEFGEEGEEIEIEALVLMFLVSQSNSTKCLKLLT